MSREKWWKVIKMILAVCVAAFTVFQLILPAITLEGTVCGMEEHLHSETCYQTVENVETQTVMNCILDEQQIHTHHEECYNAEGILICGKADDVIHSHDTNCYDAENNLICTLQEILEHEHIDTCYDSEGNLICQLTEMKEHVHTEQCFDDSGMLICGQMETISHQHTEECLELQENTVQTKELICSLPEHQHSDECFESVDEEEIIEQEKQTDEAVIHVIELIDALPDPQDMEAAFTSYEDAGDEEGYTEYYIALSEQVNAAFLSYQDLSEEQKSLVINADHLMEYSWIWETETYAAGDIQIRKGNSYKYQDYGLNESGQTYVTSEYWVSYRNKETLAYCIEPLKSGPSKGDSDKVVPLKKNDILSAVYYYGTKLNDIPISGEECYFLQDRYKDLCNKYQYTQGDETGAQFIIVHLALSYVNEDNKQNIDLNAFYHTNETAKALAKDLAAYAQEKINTNVSVPSIEMSFTTVNQSMVKDINLSSLLETDKQKTETITFNADSRQSITLDLPDNVWIVKDGETGSVVDKTVFGGTSFHLESSLNNSQNYSQSFTGNLTDYTAYRLNSTQKSDGTTAQNLFFLFGEQDNSEYIVSLSVNWINAQLTLKKVQSDDGSSIPGAVFQHTRPDNSDEAITTDQFGIMNLQYLGAGEHKLKEIKSPSGYQLNEQEFVFVVNSDGVITCNSASYNSETMILTVTDQVNQIQLKIKKTNGDPDYPLEGAEFAVYSNQECTETVSYGTTDEQGMLMIGDLHNGRDYWVKETKSPPGYTIPVDSNGNPMIYHLIIHLNPNTSTATYIWNGESIPVDQMDFNHPVIEVTIENNAILYELPETGGKGTADYIAVGMSLIGVAVVLLFIEQVRRKGDNIS